MGIENKYFDLYQAVGLYLQPEDYTMSEYENTGIILYISFPDNMVYLDGSQNSQAWPLKVKGEEFYFIWWMYRLSERKCRFQDYLAEYLIPICRQYFRRRRK